MIFFDSVVFFEMKKC